MGFLPMCLALVLLVAFVLTFFAEPASANVAREGYYWRDNTLPYDSRFAYSYDVIVHPEGGFADDGSHSFAYITAQNKHPYWDETPYGVEAVIAYFGSNAGSKEFWIAWLDAPRFESEYVSPDADYPSGFLGPHWNLSTLQGEGYMTIGTDGEGQLQRFLRVREETLCLSSSASSSTWANRVYLYNFSQGQWQLKGENHFTLPASAEQVRNYSATRGGGIWAGILETFGDGDGQTDPRPALKTFGYRNRHVEITDHGSTYSPALNGGTDSWDYDGAYRSLYRSAGDDSEWIGASPGLKRIVGRLTNSDDRSTLAVDGMPIGEVGYGGEADFDLGWLGDADQVEFATFNESGGYTWGFDLFGAGDTNLGGINLAAYCNVRGYPDVVLEGPSEGPGAAYGWRCKSGSQTYGIDMSAACREQFTSIAYAVILDPDQSESWRCFSPPADSNAVLNAPASHVFADSVGSVGQLGAWEDDMTRQHQLVRRDVVEVDGTVVSQGPGAPGEATPPVEEGGATTSPETGAVSPPASVMPAQRCRRLTSYRWRRRVRWVHRHVGGHWKKVRRVRWVKVPVHRVEC